MTIDEQLGGIMRQLIGNVALPEAMDIIERKYIAEALATTRGNITKASVLLGVHRNTLHNKVRLLGLAGQVPGRRWNKPPVSRRR